jgi:hypothetical protein
MQPINYQSLEGMNNAWKVVVKSSFNGHGYLVGGIIVLISSLLLIFQGLGLLILLPYLVFIGRRVLTFEDSIWRQFAAVNNFKVQPRLVVAAMVPPTMLKAGNSRTNSEGVSGMAGQTAFDIFWFEFTIGSGKNSHSFPTTIIRLDINAQLPYLFLRAKKGLTIGDTSSLKEKLKLEGDFNNFFTVYAEQNSEVDDLVILTPDVMQFLISQDPEYNIEFYTNSLYIIADGDLRRLQNLPGLYNFSLKLYNQIMQNLPMSAIDKAHPGIASSPQEVIAGVQN